MTTSTSTIRWEGKDRINVSMPVEVARGLVEGLDPDVPMNFWSADQLRADQFVDALREFLKA